MKISADFPMKKEKTDEDFDRLALADAGDRQRKMNIMTGEDIS
jgi:hypothetical protein